MIQGLLLASAAASAGGSILGGISAKKSADLDAYNIQTQKILGEAEAVANSNRRMEEYRYNLSANIASFAAAGRDIESDRSVKAFLDRQKEVAMEDIGQSERMKFLSGKRMDAEAASVRAEGKARLASSTIDAFTTMASGLYNYGQIKTPSSSSSAPMTSIRPRARAGG